MRKTMPIFLKIGIPILLLSTIYSAAYAILQFLLDQPALYYVVQYIMYIFSSIIYMNIIFLCIQFIRKDEHSPIKKPRIHSILILGTIFYALYLAIYALPDIGVINTILLAIGNMIMVIYMPLQVIWFIQLYDEPTLFASLKATFMFTKQYFQKIFYATISLLILYYAYQALNLVLLDKPYAFMDVFHIQFMMFQSGPMVDAMRWLTLIGENIVFVWASILAIMYGVIMSISLGIYYLYIAGLTNNFSLSDVIHFRLEQNS